MHRLSVVIVIVLVLAVVLALAACASRAAAPSGPAPASPAHGDQEHHAHHAPAGEHAHHAHGHGPHHQGAQPLGHRFGKAETWVPVFDGKDRDAWQKPELVVAALALSPGMTVADVGAGTGYFDGRLAAAVGSSGRVIAVDIEPDMVRYIGERYHATPQIEARLGTPEDPALIAASVDRILIVDTWHHIPERAAYAKKLASALKPGGFVMVVDFTMETSKGPPRNHRIDRSAVIAELESAGLRAKVVDVGLPDQYVVRAER